MVRKSLMSIKVGNMPCWLRRVWKGLHDPSGPHLVGERRPGRALESGPGSWRGTLMKMGYKPTIHQGMRLVCIHPLRTFIHLLLL